MKTFIIALLLLAFVSCDEEHTTSKLSYKNRHKKHMLTMREHIKQCISNSTEASETLKKAFEENADTPFRAIFTSLKTKLSSSDKDILKECRKKAFKHLREERMMSLKDRIMHRHNLRNRTHLYHHDDDETTVGHHNHTTLSNTTSTLVNTTSTLSNTTSSLKNITASLKSSLKKSTSSSAKKSSATKSSVKNSTSSSAKKSSATKSSATKSSAKKSSASKSSAKKSSSSKKSSTASKKSTTS